MAFDVDRQVAMILDQFGRSALGEHTPALRSLALDETEIRKRISLGAPFVRVMSFSGAARPGTLVEVTSLVVNPSPRSYSHWVFVSVCFGVPAFGEPPAALLQSRDHRWPHLSSAPFTLRAHEQGLPIKHRYVVPEVQPGTYNGSVILWREGYDVPDGEYFGRGFFYFEVLS